MSDETASPSDENAERAFRKAALIALFVAVTVIVVAVFYAFVRHTRTDQLWIPIAKQNFAAIVGLPMAALASLCIVLVLRYASGPIKLKLWKMEFEGAAGPIIFWVLCYATMAMSIQLLWIKEPNKAPEPTPPSVTPRASESTPK